VDQKTIHERRWRILGVLVVSLLVVVLDNTVLNVALKQIQEDLGATQSQLAWSINSYTLVFAGLLFTFGLLGDRFGRRRMLLIGLVLFGLASLASAYAQSPEQLIVARALMGIGGAAVLPSTLSIITNVFEPEERGRAIGVWVASVGLAVVIGPVVGGSLLESFWWGSVFLINIPVLVVGVTLVALLVPESRDPSPGRLDPGGVVLSVAGLVLLVYGIIEGGEQGSVTAPQVWVPALAGVAILGFFLWYELRSDHPALDVRLFRNPSFTASVSAIGLVFFAMMGVLFFMTFYWQLVRGFSPLETGLLFLPFAIAQMIFSPLSASFVTRFGVRAVAAAGLGVVALTLLGLGFVDAGTSLWPIGVLFFLQGAGMANVMPPVTTAIMGTVPREKAGIGSAVNNTMRQVGGALGVAVLGAVLAAQYRDGVAPALSVLPAGAREAAGESLGSTLAVAGQAGPEVLADVRDVAFSAFVDGMHLAAFLAAAVAAISTLVVVRYLPGRQPTPRPEDVPDDKAVELVGA
jgi:DHA2 family multidrug resistance protein-like MFS transporter